MINKYSLAALIITASILLADSNANAAVEGRAIAPGLEVEKIFEYEGGSVVMNKLTALGVSLNVIYPGSYASFYPTIGRNLVYFDADGSPKKYAPEDPSTTYYPSANGEYFLKTSGPSYSEPRMESVGIVREYYTRDGELLWRDDGSGEFSGGLVCVSPDGERVVYVRRGMLRDTPNIIFMDKDGTVIATHHVESLGFWFNFTNDSNYFLVSEELFSKRTENLGTTVFDKDGRLLYSLDPNAIALARGGFGTSILGGGGGYLVQVCYKIVRIMPKENRGGLLDPVYEEGVGIQVYGANGTKSWEHFFPLPLDGFIGLSWDGAYFAIARGFPATSVTVFETGTGNDLGNLKLEPILEQYPNISLSENGKSVCVSVTEDSVTRATLFSDALVTARFASDKTGSFNVTADRKFVVFSGDGTLTVYKIN